MKILSPCRIWTSEHADSFFPCHSCVATGCLLTSFVRNFWGYLGSTTVPVTQTLNWELQEGDFADRIKSLLVHLSSSKEW
jgi:hypothetical protein